MPFKRTDKMNRLLSAAIFCLAIAISYFALQLSKIHREFALLERTLQTVDSQLPSILKESAEIRSQVADTTQVVDSINQKVPDLLLQVKETTAVLAAYEAQLPNIIAQLELANENIGVVTPTLPDMIESSNQMSTAISETNESVKRLTPLIPQVLDEIAATRQALPGLLDRADNLVASAKDVGSQTTQGAVSGIFTGLLKAPVTILGTLASPFVQIFDEQITESLTKDEYSHINQAIETAWQSSDNNLPVYWTSARGNKGSVSITERRANNCFTATIAIEVNVKKQTKADTKHLHMCRIDEGEFEADRQPHAHIKQQKSAQ